MDNPQKGKKRKLPRTNHNRMQFIRTARNKTRKRIRHQKLNPNDAQAKQNWLMHPIRYRHEDPKHISVG